jgi:hypothetical protein
LMTRAGGITNLKLERELKRLEIQEKKALLARIGQDKAS